MLRCPAPLSLRTAMFSGLACLAMMPLLLAAEVVDAETTVDRPVKAVNLSPDGPDIVLIEPKEGGTYTSPIGIKIAFKPENGREGAQ